MAAFGQLHVICPGCGHDVEVAIKSRIAPAAEGAAGVVVEIWPELDHSCPPASERASA